MEQSNKTFDAFLSHSSKDKPIVEKIGRYLEKKAGLTVFLDEWILIPGEPWQEELERALSGSRTCVCFIGEGEPTSWQNEEMRAALDEMVTKGSIRIVPVLLPGAKRPEKESRMPMFLRRRTWVEFKEVWNEPDALHHLVCGIKRIRPGRGKTAHDKASIDEIRCPFCGLEVFREEDREFFFGREAVVQRLMEKLNRSRFLAIVGPSGVGKSSIVQAGLIPLLRSDSLAALFTPRMDPIEELAFALYMGCTHDRVEVKTPVEEWMKRLRDSPDALHFIAREMLESLKQKGKKGLILVVDQFEELFTQTRSEEEKCKFIAMVLYAVEKVGGPVTVIVTMRSDFLGKCSYYRDLNVYMTDYLEQIEPMSTDELRAAVEEPALAVGLEFEEGLVDRILEDASGGAGELPLVEHALRELFEDRKDRCLTMAAYNSIGGISGALAQRAEGEYKKLSDNEKGILRNMFVLRLVQPGEGTEDMRRRAVKEELLAGGGDREAAEKILKKWTDARLLTVMHDKARDQDMVDVAHESLIRKWERVRQWMAEGKEVSRQVGILRQAAWEWDQSGKNPDFLYQGARLAQLEGVMDSHAEDLTETEKEFIRTGVQRRESEQKKEIERREELLKARARVIQRSRVILAVVLIALVGMAFLWYQSNKNKNNTQRQLAMNYRDNAHLARKNGDLLKTLHWLAEAAILTTDPVSKNNYLLDMNGLWNLNKLVHHFPGKEYVEGVDFNRDGTKILTWIGDKTVRLGEVGTGKFIGPPINHVDNVEGAQFNRDDTKILTWSGNAARLWEDGTGKQIGPSMKHDGIVLGAVFNRDGTKALTWSRNGTARLWKVGTGKSIGGPMIHAEEVQGAVFNRDETKILTWSCGFSLSGTARLWEAGTGKQVGEPMTHDYGVRGALFNSNETRILTWGAEGTIRLWDAGTGKQIGPSMKHYGTIYGAVFNRDETRILTWSVDETARLWNARTGKQLIEPMKHDGYVKGAVFNRDETMIFTWSEDGTGRLWEADTGKQIGPSMIHNDEVNGAIFSSDDTKIITWGGGSVWLWVIRIENTINPIMKHDGSVLGAVFNRDGTKILTWSDDKTARLWEVGTGKQIGAPMKHDEIIKGAVFNRDETKILTWSGDREDEDIIIQSGTARLWEAGTGKSIGSPMTHDAPINGALFNRDETRILTWDYKNIRLWEAGTGKSIGKPMKHDRYLFCVMFNRDETRIIAWGYDTRLWEVGTGKQIGPSREYNYGGVKGAEFNRNRTRILTWGGNTVYLWEAETGNHIVILLVNDFFINGAMFNCDETKILTWGDDKTARIWEAGTGNLIGPLISADAPINGALFNRDETRILTWSDDKTVQLWEAGTGKPIGEPMTHDAPVNGAVFNRDETKILTWSEDGTIRFWDTDADYDFPLDLIKLQISTLTSTGFNSTTGEINIIDPWRWKEMKARYLEKAAKHYQSCKYKKANIFHRFYPHWPKK